MALNRSKGNMYDFVTHTWNTVKGRCPHDCGYCYVKAIAKRFCKEQGHARLDESELRTNLGSGNFIFVGSSNDLFAIEHPEEWIWRTLDHCDKYYNRYLFQSKNPMRIMDFMEHPVFEKAVICTTIESNKMHANYMGNTPSPEQRAIAMEIISQELPTYVTIEPIMDFDMEELYALIKKCHPQQVNIGADSGHNYLPEPSAEKVMELLGLLSEFTTINQKTNLSRILQNTLKLNNNGRMP